MGRFVGAFTASAGILVLGCGCRSQDISTVYLSPEEPGMRAVGLGEGWYLGLQGGGWIPTKKLRVKPAGGGKLTSDGAAWIVGPYGGYRFAPELAVQGGYQFASAEDWDIHLGHVGVVANAVELPLNPYLRGSVLLGGPDLTSDRLDDVLKVDNFEVGFEGGGGILIRLGAGFEISADLVYRWLEFRISETPGTDAPSELELSGVAGFIQIGYRF